MEARLFNSKQKQALYAAADGKCQMCGAPLEKGWHADHVIPHSEGGMTDVANGQALCAACNLRKGTSSAVKAWDKSIVLRDWQARARQTWIASDKSNFLVEATPGAGKTIFALRVAWENLNSGIVDRVVIIVPTDHLRVQWGIAAHAVGVDLNYRFTNQHLAGIEADDYAGIVITYQQVSFNPDIYRAQCRSKRTMVIFDEIHHCGDENTWGASVRKAFDPAFKRLALSGTPFRGDSSKIPFINYEDGRSVPDYSYSYVDALRDKVCRPVFFPAYEGDIRWAVRHRGLDDIQYEEFQFKDEISEKMASDRLRAAVDAGGEWIGDVLRDADEKLNEVRQKQPDAGGLVIAKDQIHARQLYDRLHKLTGERPEIAISEDANASQRIEHFARSSQKWIVAVKMISEGVDIKRLRVCVYATTTTTPLFFIQAVGRVVRWQANLKQQSAWFFIPADERLITLASQIMKQVEQSIEEGRERVEREAGEREYDTEYQRVFISMSDNGVLDSTVTDGERISMERLAIARQFKAQTGDYHDMEEAKIAKIIGDIQKFLGADLQPQEVKEEAPRKQRTKFEHKKDLREYNHIYVSKIVSAAGKRGGQDYNYQHVNWLANQHVGIKTVQEATVEQLQKRHKYLVQLLEDIRNGRELA